MAPKKNNDNGGENQPGLFARIWGGIKKAASWCWSIIKWPFVKGYELVTSHPYITAGVTVAVLLIAVLVTWGGAAAAGASGAMGTAMSAGRMNKDLQEDLVDMKKHVVDERQRILDAEKDPEVARVLREELQSEGVDPADYGLEGEVESVQRQNDALEDQLRNDAA